MKEKTDLPEHWQRGAIEGVHGLLQPVAHTLLQAADEIEAIMEDFPDNLLWEKPAGAASPGFHLQHITGVINRLFTYTGKSPLSTAQLQYLYTEGQPDESLTGRLLVQNLVQEVQSSISILKQVDENAFTDFRGIGRKQLPSTVIGLFFHAAEHTMRHTGQLMVTVKFLTFKATNPE